MGPIAKTTLTINMKMFRGQTVKGPEMIFMNPYGNGLLHYLQWGTDRDNDDDTKESPGTLIDGEFRNKQQPAIDNLLRLVLQEIQYHSKDTESVSFLKCLAKVRQKYPSSFQDVIDWIAHIPGNAISGAICEEVIGIILVHRLCSTVAWEKAFMLSEVAKAHLDLGSLSGGLLRTRQNYSKAGKVTLAALGAMYAVPLPNRELLTMPVFADTAQTFSATRSNVAGMYPNLFWPLCLSASRNDIQVPQIVIDRLTSAVKSLGPGNSPTRLAKMLTDPAFLALPTKPAPEDRDLYLCTVALVGEQMLNDLYGVLAEDLPIREVRLFLESRHQLPEEFFQRIKNNRRILFQSLSTFCIEGWKKDWIKNNIPLYLNGRERNIPIFKLLLYHSPLIPALFSRDEWDRYMTSREGNSLIVNKDWDIYSSFSGRYGSAHALKRLVETHFRPDDYFIRDEINGDSFLEKNLKESVESMSPDTFLSVQRRCEDPSLVIRMLSQDGGRKCVALGQAFSSRENKSYLRMVLEELQKSPPDISRMQRDISFVPDAFDLCHGEGIVQGIRDVLFGNEKTDLVVNDKTFGFMTAPIMHFGDIPGEKSLGISIFDIFLAQLPDLVGQIGNRGLYGKSTVKFLGDLMMASRYWDIPVDPFLHGNSHIRKATREKKDQEDTYCVFDRLLEILVKVSMKVRTTVKSGKTSHGLTPGGESLQALEAPFFDMVASKGERYLNSMVRKFYSTQTRKEAIALIFPSLSLRTNVHDVANSANCCSLDPMDLEMDIY